MDESGDYTPTTYIAPDPVLCDPIDKSNLTVALMVISLVLIIAVGVKGILIDPKKNTPAPYERFVSSLAQDSGWNHPELNPAFNEPPPSSDTDNGQ